VKKNASNQLVSSRPASVLLERGKGKQGVNRLSDDAESLYNCLMKYWGNRTSFHSRMVVLSFCITSKAPRTPLSQLICPEDFAELGGFSANIQTSLECNPHADSSSANRGARYCLPSLDERTNGRKQGRDSRLMIGEANTGSTTEDSHLASAPTSVPEALFSGAHFSEQKVGTLEGRTRPACPTTTATAPAVFDLSKLFSSCVHAQSKLGNPRGCT
jgi:hypothetical protein